MSRLDGYVYGETPWDVSGPREAWQATTAVYTPEVRALFEEARRTQTPPPCPQCGELVETLEQDSVSIQPEMQAKWETEGWLVTLHPCGHRMRK